jgi:hypothetical protein
MATSTDTDTAIQICLYGVFRGAVECLDPEVLFDPLEEKPTRQRLLYKSQIVKAACAVNWSGAPGFSSFGIAETNSP